jgi:hypothetical protein
MRTARRGVSVLVAVGFALVATATCSTHHERARPAFVTRSGTTLSLRGGQFRFAGANVQWLGLVGAVYGSDPPALAGERARFPSHFEVDDALATVQEMGGTVVRSFTLGVSVGCPNCLEPAPGRFNERAFRAVDYAVKSARDHGVRLVIPLVDGDALPNTNWYFGNITTYATWRNAPQSADFYTDHTIINDYVRHVDAVLNRVNSYTGVRYKDDPTIMAWETCNECGAGPHPPGPYPSAAWTNEIATHIKKVDPNHLVIDGDIQTTTRDPAAWNIAAVDASDLHYYPRWGSPVIRSLFADAATVTSHGQAFLVGEYGWDASNFWTPGTLQGWLDALRGNPQVSGDTFWALQPHADDHGWTPFPDDPPAHAAGGEWWAFYYGGNNTLSNSADDMRVRGQVLRGHAYAMRSVAQPPPHAIPPAPRITHSSQGTITWRGSPGASTYTVERSVDDGHTWSTPCQGCAGDLLSSWTDPDLARARACYRLRAVNFAGRAGPPSASVCSGVKGESKK